MVDLSRDSNGRSGQVYKAWLRQRGKTFRDNVQVATLDPFHGYKNAIDDQLEDAGAVLDAFYAEVRVMSMLSVVVLVGAVTELVRSA
jgi:transposase